MTSGTRPLAVFDMDGVLVEHRSSWRIIHERLGTSNEDSFRMYMTRGIDDEEFMARDVALWRGVLERANVSDIESILSDIAPMTGFMEAMEMLRVEGIAPVILSGGIDILANRLGDLGGFHQVHANGLKTDRDGNLVGGGILRVPLRDKGSVLRMIMGEGTFHPVSAVGDSLVDVPMFEIADISIAFRPDSEEVSRRADHVVLEADLRKVARIIIDGSADITRSLE
ncbi:MAG: HAD-IB family phosphatase [Candidatus Thermoplasmatota archaeon]|nr:HAD-IB family phosphatase [Candidatus Thermoplasmatota archaeon]